MSTRTRPLALSALSLAAALALSACGGSGEDQGPTTDASSGPATEASSSATGSASASASDSASEPSDDGSEDPTAADDESQDDAAGTGSAPDSADGTTEDPATGQDSAAGQDAAGAQGSAPGQDAAPGQGSDARAGQPGPSQPQAGGPADQSPGQAPGAEPGADAAVPAAGPGLCDAASLAGSLQPSDAGMGGLTYELVLTNTGSQPCVLSGYPGVSYIDESGQAIGLPAERVPGGGPAVTVAPGQSASAGLRETGAGGYGQVCNPHQASALLVYPPDSTEALSIDHVTQACGNPKISQLEVKGFGA